LRKKHFQRRKEAYEPKNEIPSGKKPSTILKENNIQDGKEFGKILNKEIPHVAGSEWIPHDRIITCYKLSFGLNTDESAKIVVERLRNMTRC